MSTTPQNPATVLHPHGFIGQQTSLNHESPAQHLDVKSIAIREIEKLINIPRKTLADHLTPLLLGGGTELLPLPVKAFPVFSTYSTCGYKYAYQNKMIAEVQFALTENHLFMVTSHIGDQWSNHFYHLNGVYSHSGVVETVVKETHSLMEPHCPIINYIYNLLDQEYALEGTKKHSQKIQTLEGLLKRIKATRFQELSIAQGIHHVSIEGYHQQIAQIELDPVLSWKERYFQFKKLRAQRNRVITTKSRAHKIPALRFLAPLFLKDTLAIFSRFKARPISNFIGFLELISIAPIRYLINMVKDNMGFSIAMAVYSPFTFFFITQPMNPHAMWAVGKVRSAYLDTVEYTEKLFATPTHSASNAVAGTVTGAVVSITTEGNTSHSSSANNNAQTSQTNSAPTTPSTQQNVLSYGLLPTIQQNTPEKLLMTTDVPSANQQNWDTRMSNFKAMQIAYEGNLEIAPRLGRLEQMETQYNWPLQIESTWLETQRYIKAINQAFLKASSMNPQLFNYLVNERARAEQVQLYLWDRNIRFILDHPYVLMNDSQEQTQFDYYIGRAFILLHDMTQDLKLKNSQLALPAGYEKIEALAKKFETEHLDGNSTLERLRKNSKLFQQKNSRDTNELRAYMKRQWEILYLLQNKAQEASNTGLQAYVWSVRQATWLLQSELAAKRDELSILTQTGVNISPEQKSILKHNSSQLEALHHMMVLEFTSLRKEIGEALPQDIEAKQRNTIINSNENSIKERDTLLKELKLI